MKKFIITCDTNWCGTDNKFRALAESESDLWDLAEELAYDNYSSFFDAQDLLEDLGYDIDDLSEEEIESILDNVDESEYYDYAIEECDDDEEWDSFGDGYIYTVNEEKNNWYVFYVVSYKGGELMMYKDISEEYVIDIVTCDYGFLCDYLDETENTTISDEDLLKLWEDWYSEDDQHNLYAYDTRSEVQVYQIKDNKLVESFPSKECILKRLKSYIESWKEWKRKN